MTVGRAVWVGRVAACLLLVPLASAGWASDGKSDAQRPEPLHPRQWTLIKRRYGIEVAWLRRVARGSMLEFRYRVVDAEKAKELFVRRNKPVLVDEEKGLRLHVPSFATTGEMRNSNLPRQGRLYWTLFQNPGGLVHRGDCLTLKAGKVEIPGMCVE